MSLSLKRGLPPGHSRGFSEVISPYSLLSFGLSCFRMWISRFRRQKIPPRALWQHCFVLRTGLGQFQKRGLIPPANPYRKMTLDVEDYG